MENVQAEGVVFENLGISSEILEVLKKLHYTTPTLIQQKAISPSIEGKDVVGIAQTGTGKTLAFAVPMLQRLMSCLPANSRRRSKRRLLKSAALWVCARRF
jgi:superfamily II DNA/RNA helicase